MNVIEIDIWIQSADFSIAKHPKQSLAHALALYHATDWESEIRAEFSLAEQRKEFCSPGFGMDHPHGHQLWFCPEFEGDHCWGMFSPRLGRRFLRILKLPDPELISDLLPVEKLTELIAHFYRENPVDILSNYFGS